VLTLSWAMVSTALPLWVAGHTEAPRAASGVLVVVSSLAIALLQVRCTRAAATPAAGAHTAALLLLAGGIAHIAGELLFVAASWGLSVPLTPDGRAGEYQGVFAAGQAVALTVAPLLMTAVVVGWGQAGWIALAALFVLATLPATGDHAPGAAGARAGRGAGGGCSGSGSLSVSCHSGGRSAADSTAISATTTSGSNCVPAQRSSSATASATGSARR
jgi:hypothetical protein